MLIHQIVGKVELLDLLVLVLKLLFIELYLLFLICNDLENIFIIFLKYKVFIPDLNGLLFIVVSDFLIWRQLQL